MTSARSHGADIASTISASSLAEERRWHDRYAIGAAVGLGAGGDNDGVQ
jgi:hypothetical protein